MLSTDIFDEINLLNQFHLESTSVGIKVHARKATPQMVTAAERLFAKGLTNQVDGGYLTERGVVAANHAQTLVRLLAEE